MSSVWVLGGREPGCKTRKTEENLQKLLQITKWKKMTPVKEYEGNVPAVAWTGVTQKHFRKQY